MSNAWAPSLEVHEPFWGVVNQVIQAALLHNLGQLGLINITKTAACDAGVERRIVEGHVPRRALKIARPP